MTDQMLVRIGVASKCAICGDPTHSTERHEETLSDDL